MKSIKPLNTQILVHPNQVQQQTSSGLIISGGDGDSRSATVLAIGSEVSNKDIAVGAEIYLLWDKAMSFRYAGEKYAFVSEENVVAVLESTTKLKLVEDTKDE